MPSTMAVKASTTPTAEAAKITHFRSSLFIGMRHAIQTQLGQDQWIPFLESLHEVERKALNRHWGSADWVPTQVIVTLFEQFKAYTGRELSPERGAAYAQEQLTRTHRWLMKFTKPDLFLRQAPRMFAFYHRGGLVHLDEIHSGYANLSLWADISYPQWLESVLPIWARRALELSGAKEVEIRYEAPNASASPFEHHYHLKWR
jgi:hypothetical protein